MIPVKQTLCDKHVDIVIIGAGFTWLATAGRLAELLPNARIASINILEVGQDNSCRHAGFITDLPYNLDSSEADVTTNMTFRDSNNFAIPHPNAARVSCLLASSRKIFSRT